MSALLKVPTLQRWIRTVTGQAGLRARFSKSAQIAYTTEKEIVIPAFGSDITERDIIKLRHFVAHECAHHTEGSFLSDTYGTLCRRYNVDFFGDHLVGHLWMILEDSRIERAGAKKYSGDKKIYSEGWAELLKEGNAKPINMMEVPKEKREWLSALLAAQGFDKLTRKDWNTGCILHADDYVENLPEESRENLELLGGLEDEVRNLKTPDDALDLAEEFYRRMLGEPEPQSEEERREKQEQRKAGNSEETETEGEAEGSRFRYLDYLLSPHDEETDVKGTPPKSGTHIDYTDHEKADVEAARPATDAEIRVWNLHRDKSLGNAGHYHDAFEGVREEFSSSKALANKLRRILQVKSQATYIGNQKKGPNFHKKNLYRVGVINVGDWNERIKRKKYTSTVLDTAICLLVDYSGSMGGTKLIHATESAVLLNEAISRSLRIPVEVLMFSEASSIVEMGIGKGYDDVVSESQLRDNMYRFSEWTCQNSDGDAVLFAYNRLKRRPEARKILLVLSDGSPAADKPGNDMLFAQKVVKDIEREKAVDIYGIGIMDNNVKQIYSNNSVIRNAGELENAVLQVIQQKVV